MSLRMDHPVLRAVTVAALVTQLGLPAGALAQQAMQAQDVQDSAKTEHQRQAIETPDAMPLPEQDLKLRQPTPVNRLQGDERILLVLDRFTYGPRPGDLEHLRQIGLSEWFRQQLNPRSIDDSALDARLANYPAMKLPLGRMMEQFPPNDVIRRAARRGADVIAPDGPNRAVFNDRVAAYREREKAKSIENKASADPDSMTATDGKKKAYQRLDPKPLPVPLEQLYAMPPADRFNVILKLTPAQMYDLRRETGRDLDKLVDGFTPQQMETMAAFQSPEQVIAQEAVETRLLRDIYSERQLEQVMVDFWLNHFNLYMKKNGRAPYYIASFERDVIRPRALGKFPDLLLATATSPAMLEYLDQYLSIGAHSESAHPFFNSQNTQPQKKASGLNENYAREVMELHTVGVDAGYTQKDVTEMAKVLTGWTVDKPRGGDEPTTAAFDYRKHEPGTKVVMGQTVKEDGLNEGVKMLLYLASTPQCAHFISQKLAVRFVSDNPPKAMVDRMAGTFLDTHGDIRQTLATMINSPEFFTAATYRNKVKTPQDFVVSAVRAVKADVDNPGSLAKAIGDLGMPLYGHQTPEGYSMKSEAWNSTSALIERLNFSMALASNRIQGVHADLDQLLGPEAASLTPQKKQELIEARLLHATVSEHTENLIAKETNLPQNEQIAQLRQVSAIHGTSRIAKGGKKADKHSERNAGGVGDLAEIDTQAAMAAGLVLGSPEFQRR